MFERSLLAPLAIAFSLIANPVHASETQTYTYDELGRLIAITTTGTVNNGQSVSTGFDAAGNRTSYAVSGVTSSTPVISIANSATTEGGSLNFTVTRSGPTTGSNAVSFASANGSAIAPGDYSASSGLVTFAAGETTKTVSVATIDDALVESPETVLVTLSAPTNGAALGNVSATGTINDNDAATADLALGNALVVEGNVATFTVTRSGNVGTSVSANYGAAGGTAVSGADFAPTSGTVTLLANQTTTTIAVPTVNDAIIEPTETFTLTLSAASAGATITQSSGAGTITDNDSSLAIGNATAAEGGTLAFPVTRSGAVNTAVSVSYTTISGTAIGGNDFAMTSGTVTFAPNQSSAAISVPVIDDATYEVAETLSVTLSNPSSDSTITTPTATGTITDNDPYPYIILTDSNFSVLQPHQQIYQCFTYPVSEFTPGGAFCWIISSGYFVFGIEGTTASFDPGYSLSPQGELQVEAAYYNTGTTP